MTPIVEVIGLEKRFGGIVALGGADFSLYPGEVHALLGANGAGKSTLIKVLSGFIRPDGGIVRFDGADAVIGSVATAQSLGIQTIHQELELAEALPVYENIFLGQPLARHGIARRAAMIAAAERALKRLGVAIDPRAAVSSLSVSDRQVVEIARTLTRRSRVVIMDEPTAALPPREVARLFAIIRELTQQGIAVVYVSHRLDEIQAIADRVTVMREGRRVFTAPIAQAPKETIIGHMLGRSLAADAADSQPAPAGARIVDIENLCLDEGLSGFDLQVRAGEIVGLFGLLGAGQQLVGDALFGLRPVQAGRFEILGRARAPRHPGEALSWGIGFVPADRKGAGLALRLSVKDNLFMTAWSSLSRWGFVRRREHHRRAAELSRRYGVRCASVDQAVGELSGGNQQKVSIAKWATRSISLLYLDEPSRGVDIGARTEIYRLLRQFAAGGGACIVNSTDAEEIARVCDRAVVVRSGAMAANLSKNSLGEAALIAAAS